MLSVQKFSVLLHQLQQVERAVPRDLGGVRAQGEIILRAFIRYASFDRGAVYFSSASDETLRLASRSEDWRVPEEIRWQIPGDVMHIANDATRFEALEGLGSFDPRPDALIPLCRGEACLGFIALQGGPPPGDPGDEELLLRAIASYLSTILSHQRMTSEMREGDFQLKYRLWELESLYDIGLAISSTLDLEELTEEILVRAVSLLNARRAALYLKKGKRFALEQSFGEVRGEFFDDEVAADLSKRLVDDGEPILFERGADCIFPNCESFVALPIRTSTEVVGVLAAADRELRNGGVGAFEEGDIRLLSRFASQAAIALENARLHREALAKQMMERELELAATIQRDILPRGVPNVKGFEIDAWTRPARQLGGDYHALFEREGGFTFCVADVSGKSTPAALLVSSFHAALQLLIAEGRDLGDIATELNRHIHHWSSQTKFITMILAAIDPESSTIRYVNAGHNPGYLVRGDELEEIHSHGLPIGMMPGSTYEVMSRSFEPGTLAVFYSDGITEAENLEGHQFGNERLAAILAKSGESLCLALRAAIVSSVDVFSGEAPQTDDQTLVIVRRLAEAR